MDEASMGVANRDDASLIFKADNLSFERDWYPLFEGLSFDLHQGDLLHVIGPNGVGKTTLLKIMIGLMMPSQGSLHWSQHSAMPFTTSVLSDSAALSQNGYVWMGHAQGLKSSLTPKENLLWLCGTTPQVKSKVLAALDELDLGAYADRAVKTLSCGQIKRAQLCRLVIDPSPVWVLDEPFVALDVNAIHWLEAKMQHHIDQGGAIVFTSHQPWTKPKEGHRTLDLTKWHTH